MAKRTEIFHQNDWDFSSLPRVLDNLAMGPKQHHLYSKPEYMNSQHASFYCNIHHNMVHFTAISTTTCFNLLQDTPQPGSFYCNITTCFILLQYQSQHASFYCNMLHFTAISTTTCFILLEHANWNKDVIKLRLGWRATNMLYYLIIFKQRH